jgi:hypothetical protein
VGQVHDCPPGRGRKRGGREGRRAGSGSGDMAVDTLGPRGGSCLLAGRLALWPADTQPEAACTHHLMRCRCAHSYGTQCPLCTCPDTAAACVCRHCTQILLPVRPGSSHKPALDNRSDGQDVRQPAHEDNRGPAGCVMRRVGLLRAGKHTQHLRLHRARSAGPPVVP